jgi:hypothetical protein
MKLISIDERMLIILYLSLRDIHFSRWNYIFLSLRLENTRHLQKMSAEAHKDSGQIYHS